MVNTSRDEAYEKIKHMLNSGELKTGDVTSVNELSDKLDIGRTPIRDAVLKLNDEGIIQVIPRKGIFVSGISSKDIKEIFELRLAIELYVVEAIISRSYEESFDGSLCELSEILTRQEVLAKDADNEEFLISDENFHLKLVEILNNTRMSKLLMDSRKQLFLYGFKSLTFHDNAVESVEEHKRILEAIKNKDKMTAREELTKHLSRTKNIILLE